MPVRSAEFRAAFAADVRESLARTPRQLSSRYFYDELGSALFEAICRLPWYRITRTETAMLARHARDILDPLGRPVGLAELGCGSGEKLATFAAAAGEAFSLVQLVDISPAALEMATYRLTAAGIHSIRTHHATYEEGVAQAVAERAASGSLLVMFLGSNIGNFDPPVARTLLAGLRSQLRAGDAVLLGSDLVKSERDLLMAYGDPLGVTAAFNLNLLRRINDELDGNFDLDGFVHSARWNADASRVDAYLVSVRRQPVTIGAAGCEMVFERDEPIWTESSYKYQPTQVIEEGRTAGFTGAAQWIDEDAHFALTRFSV